MKYTFFTYLTDLWSLFTEPAILICFAIIFALVAIIFILFISIDNKDEEHVDGSAFWEWYHIVHGGK